MFLLSLCESSPLFVVINIIAEWFIQYIPIPVNDLHVFRHRYHHMTTCVVLREVKAASNIFYLETKSGDQLEE